MDCFLQLTVGGNAVEGNSPIKKIDQTDTSKMIQCLSFNDRVTLTYQQGPGTADSGAIYTPITIVKEIDKSSPLLSQALTDQIDISKGVFHFFEPGPEAKKRLCFKVTIERGKVCEMSRSMSKDAAMTESVSFVFGKITWEHVLGKTAHTDDFGTQ
jgi:type VI secretion system secreted protein Hcp